MQNIAGSEILKFGIILSENVGVSTAIKGAFRVNPYNLNNIINALDKVYFMKEEERRERFNKDLEHVIHNTTFSWIKSFFLDLKRNSMV